jgi:putative transposase
MIVYFYPTKAKSKSGWFSRGFLPHFDDGKKFQFVTFRLQDSIPESVLRDAGLQNKKYYYRLAEKYLDNLHGSLILQRQEVAELVARSILFYAGKKYRLISWVIMPNHVHLLIQPINNYPVHRIVGSLKSYTSREVNKLLGATGSLWANDYFDRFIRDEDHFKVCVDYIEKNPVKSKLVKSKEEWKWGSAGLNKIWKTWS